MDKILRFHIYRYHLLPIDTEDKQLKLFPEKKLTFEEIKEKKNIFFQDVIEKLSTSNNKKYPLKLEHSEDEYYLFKIAQKKTTLITRNFENAIVDNEPYVYVIINNNPDVQKIAISENPEAFSSTTVVKNILKSTFNKDLKYLGLNVEIEQLFNSVNFWEYVNKHKTEITHISFEFVKPNLAEISKSLPSVFKNFTSNVNSHKSQISISAPEKGTLNNINKKNKDIDGLVDYTSKGAGSIKLKVKGIRKQLNTKENPEIIEINELDIEGPSEQVIKLYKEIVKK